MADLLSGRTLADGFKYHGRYFEAACRDRAFEVLDQAGTWDCKCISPYRCVQLGRGTGGEVYLVESGCREGAAVIMDQGGMINEEYIIEVEGLSVL